MALPAIVGGVSAWNVFVWVQIVIVWIEPVSGGCVTAGIDFDLTLVSIMVDRPTAELIQLGLEYNPAPPFNAGSPDTAPAEILALMREKSAPLRPRRDEANRRAAARLG